MCHGNHTLRFVYLTPPFKCVMQAGGVAGPSAVAVTARMRAINSRVLNSPAR